MIPRKSPFTRPIDAWVDALVATLLLSAIATTASASLKDSPPKNVSLDGTWQIDAANSEDAAEILDNSRDTSSQSGSNRGGGMRGGGGMGGHRGRNRQGAADTDRSADTAAANNGRSTRQKILNEFAQNPPTLTIQTKQHALKILTATDLSDCEAGGKVSIVDSNGSSERQCGWDGRAWVVETAYAHSFIRNDRYELSKDGKQLTYTTKVSGEHLSTMKHKRVYMLNAQNSITSAK